MTDDVSCILDPGDSCVVINMLYSSAASDDNTVVILHRDDVLLIVDVDDRSFIFDHMIHAIHNAAIVKIVVPDDRIGDTPLSWLMKIE